MSKIVATWSFGSRQPFYPRVLPTDVAPIDVLRVPLVEEVVYVSRGIVHGLLERTCQRWNHNKCMFDGLTYATRIIHPPSWSIDMSIRSPTCEQRVVAHVLHLIRCKLCTALASSIMSQSCEG